MRVAVSRPGAIAAALALLVATSTAAVAARPVELRAGFAHGARLGASTSLHAELAVDPRGAPAVEVRVYYPASIGVLSSGLGLTGCRRPASDFATVIIAAQGLGGCSPNSVMAFGTARAIVRLSDGERIPEYANVTLLAGDVLDGRIGLVVFVDGVRPFGGKLAYAGELLAGSGPFGGALVARLPPVPSLDGIATVALTHMRLDIGSRAIVYRTRSGMRYRPDGVALPARCPHGGFRFRAEVRFSDGSRTSTESVVSCPLTPGSA